MAKKLSAGFLLVKELFSCHFILITPGFIVPPWYILYVCGPHLTWTHAWRPCFHRPHSLHCLRKSHRCVADAPSSCACALSRVWLFAIPWTVAHQAPLSMGFSRQKYWSGLPFPSGVIPDPGIEPGLLHCRQFLYHWATWKPYLGAVW